MSTPIKVIQLGKKGLPLQLRIEKYLVIQQKMGREFVFSLPWIDPALLNNQLQLRYDSGRQIIYGHCFLYLSLFWRAESRQLINGNFILKNPLPTIMTPSLPFALRCTLHLTKLESNFT